MPPSLPAARSGLERVEEDAEDAGARLPRWAVDPAAVGRRGICRAIGRDLFEFTGCRVIIRTPSRA